MNKIAYSVVVVFHTTEPLSVARYREVERALMSMGLEDTFYDNQGKVHRLTDFMYTGDFMARRRSECAAFVQQKVERILEKCGVAARLSVVVTEGYHCIVSDVVPPPSDENPRPVLLL